MTNLVLITGLLGTGKTLFATLIALNDYEKYNLNIKTNYWTDFSEKIDPLDILKFELENCTVVLDEAHTVFDSRNANSPINKVGAYFISQSRKRNVNVILTAQLGHSVELRIRELVPFYYKAMLRGKYSDFVIKEYFGGTDIETGVKYVLPYEEMKNTMFHRYKTEEVIMPLSIDENLINFDLILEDFKACSNKKMFIRLINRTYPQLTLDDISASYDFLKKNDFERAKRVLFGNIKKI